MKSVIVLNGPNLQRLGSREPEIYGTVNYEQLAELIKSTAKELGISVEIHQSDSEADLIGYLHRANDNSQDVVINPGAFTHYSYALADACKLHTASGNKVIEIHISNPASRETFRQNSVISPAVSGVISGFGVNSYLLALRALVH